MSSSDISIALSPSSLSTFLSCQKKYWHKKVANTPPDTDVEEDTEALRVGKAFHEVLEECRHVLDGLEYSKVWATVWKHELDADAMTPMIYAMLSKYKIMHEKSGLKATFCEIEVKTEGFLGYVDVVLEDKEGGWWIGDMKTSAAYYSNIAAGLARHPQLNLYAAHAFLIAAGVGLDISKFRGCRYRMTTKSKLIRKKTESVSDYIERLKQAVKSVDFILPIEDMSPHSTLMSHERVRSFIEKNRGGESYLHNYANCMQFFKPCEFFSHCHGKEYTKADIKCVNADDENA